MAADFEIKAHDLLPVLRVNLTSDGLPVDLTLATSIKLIMSDSTTFAVVVNRAVTVEDAVNGLVRYDWQGADTATAGQYLGEFEAIWPGTKPQTFPTDSYLAITIFRDLNNA